MTSLEKSGVLSAYHQWETFLKVVVKVLQSRSWSEVKLRFMLWRGRYTTVFEKIHARRVYLRSIDASSLEYEIQQLQDALVFKIGDQAKIKEILAQKEHLHTDVIHEQSVHRDLATLERLTSATNGDQENRLHGSPNHMLLGAEESEIKLGYEHRIQSQIQNKAAREHSVVVRSIQKIPRSDWPFERRMVEMKKKQAKIKERSILLSKSMREASWKHLSI